MTSNKSDFEVEGFWDKSARWNVHRAIVDIPGLDDPDKKQETFDVSGRWEALRLVPFITPEMRVVDLGCGIGRVLRPLAPFCREIVGVDVSSEMVKSAREYVAGCDNVRIEKGDGTTLPFIEDESVGFLYSVLCFIHIEKRAAYRYLREVFRVLRPGGMASLQFENILAAKGVQEFIRVVDLPEYYPLEFYSAPELDLLLGSCGLQVVGVKEHNQFLYVTVIKGVGEGWLDRIASGVQLSDCDTLGDLSGELDLSRADGLRASISSRLQEVCNLRAVVILYLSSGVTYSTQGVVSLPPGAEEKVEFRFSPAENRWAIEQGGRPAVLAIADDPPPKLQGTGHVWVGLCPPGTFPEDVANRFPHLSASVPYRIEAS